MVFAKVLNKDTIGHYVRIGCYCNEIYCCSRYSGFDDKPTNALDNLYISNEEQARFLLGQLPDSFTLSPGEQAGFERIAERNDN